MPIMWGNPNKAITTIIGMKSDKPEMSEDNGNKDYEMALDAACEDMLKAIETKSVKMLCQAMKDFHALYDEKHEEDEAEDMEEMEDNRGM